MSNDARVSVAVDVGFPLPTRRVWVAGADVLGLEPLEFLLGTKFVRLLIVEVLGQYAPPEQGLGSRRCGPTIMRLEFEHDCIDWFDLKRRGRRMMMMMMMSRGTDECWKVGTLYASAIRVSG